MVSFKEYDLWAKKYCPSGFIDFCGYKKGKKTLKNFNWANNFNLIDNFKQRKLGVVAAQVNAYDIYRPCYIDDGNYIECNSAILERYLNKKEVQNAIHVVPKKFKVCP